MLDTANRRNIGNSTLSTKDNSVSKLDTYAHTLNASKINTGGTILVAEMLKDVLILKLKLKFESS